MKLSPIWSIIIAGSMSMLSCGDAVERVSNTEDIDRTVILEATNPPDNDQNAGISGIVTFTFNKNMDWHSFNNMVSARNSTSKDLICSTLKVDQDLNTISVRLPMQLMTEIGRLPSEETFTITIPNEIKTSEGKTLSDNLQISFKTFKYHTVFDGSSEINGETWGIAYHQATDSIYYLGESIDGPVIRRFSLTTGETEKEWFFYPNSQAMYGGLDIWGATLYVNESYDSKVTAYEINSRDDTLTYSDSYSQVDFDDDGTPETTLSEVLNTVKIGDLLYFSTGSYHGETAFQDIISYNTNTTDQNWSIVVVAETFGFDNDEDKNLDAINIDGTDYLILAEYGSHKLFKFSTAGEFVDSIEIGPARIVDLDHDDQGNIYVATDSGIYKYSGKTLELLEQREGIKSCRITIKNREGSTDVFCQPYQDAPFFSLVEFPN